MNISLKQLRAFVAVGKTKSFTLAADQLHITQPALSGLIKELENSLAVKLIDRTTRQIHLSKIGQEFLPLIDKNLNDLDSLLSKIKDRQLLQTGTVHLAAPQLLSSTLLPAVIAAFRQAYPSIQIKLLDSPIETIIHRVYSGEVDIGIGPEREIGMDIKANTLFSGHFMAVFPKSHDLQAVQHITWRDLLNHPLITLQGHFSEKLLLDLHAHDSNLQFQAKHEVAFMSTALAMVNSGLGVATCMRYASSLVQLYDLELRPLVDPVISRRFCTFTHSTKSLTPEANCFLMFLQEYVRENEEVFC